MSAELDPGAGPGELVHALGHRQRLIWAGQVLDPEVPLYNMAHAFTIGGGIDVAAFGRAFDALVAGHDALRTVIEVGPDGPRQRIVAPVAGTLDVVDLRSEADPTTAATAWADARSTRRFELDRCLYDAALLLVDDDCVVWFLNQHHLICDAWSVSLLLGRQGELYQLAVDGQLDEAEPGPSYLDFLRGEVEQVDSKSRTRAAAHWADKLAKPVEPLTFFGPRPDDPGTETVRVEARIDGERAERLTTFLERPEVASLSPELTAMRFFQTVLVAYLHRIGGQDRIMVGTPFHNRAKRDQKKTAGLFMHLVPVVTTIDAGETMSSLSAKVGAEIFENLQHARHPVEVSDDGGFEVVLNYLHVAGETFAGRPVEDRWVHPGAGDRGHSLRLQVRRSEDGFRLFFDAKTALFGAEARSAMAEQLLLLIDRWLDDVDVPVAAVDLLTGAETGELIVDFNRDRGPGPPSISVPAAIEAQVAATPEAVAVRCGSETLTYRQLDRRTGALAKRLRDRGVAGGGYVGVLVPRSIDAVVALLGVLRSGSAYLPIEPQTPPARLAQMVADTAAPVICTDEANAEAVRDAGAEPLLVAEPGDHAEARDPGDAGPEPGWDRSTGLDSEIDLDRDVGFDLDLDREVGDDLDRPAYVIFTSGSTGRPKGVPISHRGLANYVDWAARYYTAGQPLAFALHTSLAFDLTITSIFVPLVTGGSILVYGQGTGDDDADDGTPPIIDVFTDDQVDVVKATPSHLALVRQLGLRASRLRTLIIGGEDLSTDLAAAIQQGHPDAALHNEYGPTETVVGCMIHRYDPTGDRERSVPIGTPAANAEILLLDRNGRAVPPGVVGEIHIGGPAVAGRYLARPELSAERFITRPDHLPTTTNAGALLYRSGDLGRWVIGSETPKLHFLGRADDQVKIRGHRIELGEIDAVLAEQPGVEAAAALVISEDLGPGPIAAAVPDDELINCGRCGLPSNYPGAGIDDGGTCSLCRGYETYRDKVDDYFGDPGQLRGVAEAIAADRGDKPYDCLVLLSGGKDSTYMLYQVVALGLTPLVFTLDNGYISPTALANCRRVCGHLGVDLHIATTEHMNEIFRDSLERFSNVCNGCFKTIYTLSMNLAKEHGLHHIVTGLARGQLFETRLSDMYDRRIFDVDAIDRFVLDARKAYHQIDDAVSEHLDVSAFVDGAIYDEITFVDYYRYVDVALDEVLGFLAEHTPWSRPDDTGRSTNCLINDVGIHVHRQERGFHNYALPYSWDVRLGHKQRDAALDELDDDIDLDFVTEVMVEIGYKPKPPLHQRTTARLVAHYQATQPIDDGQLRAGLRAHLPDSMMPTAFVHHRQLPLTVNGKIDRAELVSTDPTGGRFPSGPTAEDLSDEQRLLAERLAAVWSWTFDRTVDLTDNFFDLGGDSITAIQIVDRASTVGLTITPRQLFEAQTPAATATIATWTDTEIAAAIGPEPDTLPLTPTQAGMLFHTLAEPEAGLYQGQIVHRLRGTVDPVVLARCWDDLVGRLPTLRTVFLWEGVDEPIQTPGRPAPPLTVADWSTHPRGEERLERFLAEDRAERFALSEQAPARATLIRTSAGWVLVWSFHHIAFDGWSIALAMNELLGAHQAESTGEPWLATPRRSFAGYLDWLDRQDRTEAESFWRAELAGFDAPTVLPGRTGPVAAGDPGRARARSGPRPYGAMQRQLDRSDTEALIGYAGRSRVTLSTVLQAAWALVLDRYQGPGTDRGGARARSDVVFGVTTSGRPAGLAGAETMVGMLVTTLPARITVEGALEPTAWLQHIQDRQLTVRDHEHAPLVDIQRWSDVPAGRDLFESILVVENFPDAVAPDDPEAVAIEDRAYRVQSNYPLSVIVLPGAELTIKIVHDPDRFDEATIGGLLDHLEGAIASLIGGAATVDELSIVGRGEVDRLARLAIGPAIPDELELLPTTIDRVAASDPDAPAVIDGSDVLHYGQLIERADEAVEALRRAGVGPGTIVGILAERSAAMVTAIVAVHRAGAAYLPLDPTYPADRLAAMVADAAVAAVLATDGTSVDALGLGDAVAEPLTGTGLILWSTVPARTQATAGSGSITAADPAYLIYTSGSTGRPNGVTVSHGNLAWSTGARRTAYGHQPEAFLLLSSFSFDSSIVGLFWTLASGGAIVLPGPGEELDVRALNRLVADHGVTHTLGLPSLYALLLEHTDHRSLETLTTVIVAGEACPRSVVEAHAAALPEAELHNEYGPTEASVWCAVERCWPDDDATGPVPIGAPAPGATVAVLDRFGRPAGFGVPGEIHVAGPGVTAGYRNRPELTAERFVVHDGRRWYRTRDIGTVGPDGRLRFGGRADDQVKVRGHRIELAEVEAALIAHPEVAGAVAVVDRPGGAGCNEDTDGAGGVDGAASRLVAHVELVGDGASGPEGNALAARLQAQVGARLPDAFVPSAIAITDVLPRLPNGKIDRNRLPTIAASTQTAPEGRAPATESERVIAAIWADLLPGAAFGADDDFFDVGGHSLLAISLVERLRRASGVDLPLAALLATPTIASLAARVDRERSEDAAADRGNDGGIVELRSSGDRVPLYLVPPAAGTALSFRELAVSADPAQPLYCFEPVGNDGRAEPHDTVEAMAAHYLDGLRTAQPDGRYRIGGSCLGAIVAWEMVRQLRADGDDVELLVFLDPGPPHSGPGWSYQLPSKRTVRQLVRTTWDIVAAGDLLDAVKAVWRRNAFDRIGRVHYRAQLSYVAERIVGLPIIWLESEELARDMPEFLVQWRILAGDDLNPIVVAGTTHDGLMTGQASEVRAMTEELNRALTRFEASGRAG